MLNDDKIDNLITLLNLVSEDKGAVEHTNDYAYTRSADDYWNKECCISIIDTLIFDTKYNEIDTLKINIENKITKIVEIISSNIIENNISKKLKPKTNDLEKIENSLNEQLNKMLEKMDYYINIKGVYKKRNLKEQPSIKINDIKHILKFIDTTSEIIHYYLKEKEIVSTIEKKKNNEAPKISVEVDYQIAGQITGLSFKNTEGFKEKKNNEWQFIERGTSPLNNSVNKLLKNKIYTEFSKHPSIAKQFFEYTLFRKEREKIDDIFRIGDLIKEKLSILKAEKVNVIKLLNPFLSTEDIEDVIKEFEIIYDTKKLIKGLLSNKNKHLMGFENTIDEQNQNYESSKNYKYFKELVGLNITEKELQESIGKKLSRYKNDKEFGEALKMHINLFNQFDMDSIKNKAKQFNTEIIDENYDDNQLILKINDYEASKALGSQSWCISYHERYFNDYTSNQSTQYFIFNFNKEFENELAMVGVTLNSKLELKNAYDKDDCRINQEEYNLENIIKIIKEKNNKKTRKFKNN